MFILLAVLPVEDFILTTFLQTIDNFTFIKTICLHLKISNIFMEILKKLDKNAVFIDHNELVSHIYKTYKFHPSVFNYIRKAPSRKRKLPPDIEDLSRKTNDFLSVLHIPGQLEVSSELPKIWDEKIEFPNFEGGNNADTLTKFNFLSQTFIIPSNCRFINKSIFEIKEDLGLFDFIVMDPPWRNKYIRRVKKADKNLGYQMIDNESLSEIPIGKMIHRNSLVAIWCTNSIQHQKSLLDVFLGKWDLKLVVRLVWIKLSSSHEIVSDFNEETKKQPFETLFVACHKEADMNLEDLTNTQMILSTPSVIHSHKPPLLKIFEKHLPSNPRCLEIFARYLQPNFTSIGLEVLKLMDLRLYVENKCDEQCF